MCGSRFLSDPAGADSTAERCFRPSAVEELNPIAHGFAERLARVATTPAVAAARCAGRPGGGGATGDDARGGAGCGGRAPH